MIRELKGFKEIMKILSLWIELIQNKVKAKIVAHTVSK